MPADLTPRQILAFYLNTHDLKHEMRQNQPSLHLQTLLTIPGIVAKIEKYFELAVTGKAECLRRNFDLTYYTPRAFTLFEFNKAVKLAFDDGCVDQLRSDVFISPLLDPDTIIEKAAQYGHHDILAMFDISGKQRHLFMSAVKGGQLDLVQKYYDPELWVAAVDIAMEYGHLPVFRFLDEKNKVHLDHEKINLGMRSGNVEMMRFIFESQDRRKQLALLPALAYSGDVDFIREMWASAGVEFGAEFHIQSHVTPLEYLEKGQTDAIPEDIMKIILRNMMKIAIERDHFNLVKTLFRMDVKPYHFAYLEAEIGKKGRVGYFLNKRGNPPKFSYQNLRSAFAMGGGYLVDALLEDLESIKSGAISWGEFHRLWGGGQKTRLGPAYVALLATASTGNVDLFRTVFSYWQGRVKEGMFDACVRHGSMAILNFLAEQDRLPKIDSWEYDRLILNGKPQIKDFVRKHELQFLGSPSSVSVR